MNKRKYSCSECGIEVVIYVEPTTPPTHLCKRHLNKPRLLEETTKGSK